ncbi:NUDIX domain-containing protein [Prevotella bivia]|uniref:ADP-ribose pyrophosphatase n=1 Tax=Prevotella bivia DSM 20514 TaxID=868129 RepID=I4Z8Q8_9BACT|nr:NUDIX domain-containing protein [Prevotella bivia]EFB93348.1 mutator mutT protein [Prevotella bivia JCVIHMP010]EIM32600.1 ADP-ribose pyrophosphatase [Prevotella bivia DSM 20514]
MVHILDKFRYCPVCGSEHFLPQNEKSKRCKDCGFEYFLNPSAAVAAFILNDQNELLVTRRKREPAMGTLDLPGGFCDIGETIEEALVREVMEETRLLVKELSFFCSLPNKYLYSNFMVPTLDIFYICRVSNPEEMEAHDDAAEVLWLPMEQIDEHAFGLASISKAVGLFKQKRIENLKK